MQATVAGLDLAVSAATCLPAEHAEAAPDTVSRLVAEGDLP